jgi:hypothetical protein
MLLMMNLDSTVWIVAGIADDQENEMEIGNAQNLHHINPRKGNTHNHSKSKAQLSNQIQ